MASPPEDSTPNKSNQALSELGFMQKSITIHAMSNTDHNCVSPTALREDDEDDLSERLSN